MEEYGMDKPAVYRIKVRGVVPDSWIDRLGGLQITSNTPESVTMLGRLADQSALAGDSGGHLSAGAVEAVFETVRF